MTIDEIIEAKKKELQEVRKNIYSNRVFFIKKGVPTITFNEYVELLTISADLLFAKNNKNVHFVIDRYNKEVIKQLYFYSCGISEFNGKFEKGIMLAGKNGVGKTILMKAFLSIFETLSNKRFIHSLAIELFKNIEERQNINYKTIPLYVEDLGKETKIINDYGTQKQTIPELFHIRYSLGSWSFACTNYNNETLTKFYGTTITDRFKEMFNILKLDGESRRK